MPTTSPGRFLCIMLLIVITIAVVIVLNTNTAVPVPGGGTGTLTGNITLGPLCPVEPCIIAPDRLAAAFVARTIVVSIQGGAVIAEAVTDPQRGYSIALKPGTYSVDIRH